VKIDLLRYKNHMRISELYSSNVPSLCAYIANSVRGKEWKHRVDWWTYCASIFP